MPTKWVLPSKHALLNGNSISRKEASFGVFFSITAVTKYHKLSDLKQFHLTVLKARSPKWVSVD